MAGLLLFAPLLLKRALTRARPSRGRLGYGGTGNSHCCGKVALGPTLNLCHSQADVQEGAPTMAEALVRALSEPSVAAALASAISPFLKPSTPSRPRGRPPKLSGSLSSASTVESVPSSPIGEADIAACRMEAQDLLETVSVCCVLPCLVLPQLLCCIFMTRTCIFPDSFAHRISSFPHMRNLHSSSRPLSGFAPLLSATAEVEDTQTSC